MPRKKVDPSRRVRIAQACTKCQASKKKCDGKQPCSLCVRKGKEPECTFGRQSPDPEQAQSTVDSEDSPGEARHRLNPRLLRDSHGEKVFIGPSASLAFLQFIRTLVGKLAGASEFTENPYASRMLEVSQPAYHDHTDVVLDDHTRLEYGRNFAIVTSGLLEFDGDVLSTPDPAISDLIIAIGAQAAPSSTFQANVERNALASAQIAAFSDLLESPSVMMVQVFLLLAFYMIQACRRNAAYMYIGVAARAAYALGLSESDEHTTLWQSIVNLDVIVSSILGRATATSSVQLQGSPALSSPVEASYRLSLLVYDIVNNLYKQKTVTTRSAFQYLEKLEDWIKSLPNNLRITSAPQNHDYLAYKHVNGCLSISCYYHFAIILVCRPFLISHILHRMLSQKITFDEILSSEDEERRQLAEKCIKAASYMAQTCAEVQNAGYLLESAPILKAWIFAAGLVLGLQLFSQSDSDISIKTSTASAQALLQKLAVRSPQASHYYDILNHFEAVVKRKREQTRKTRTTSDVEKLIDFSGFRPTNSNAEINSTDFSGSIPDFDNFNHILDGMQDGLIGQDEVLLDWDQVAWQF